MARLSEIVEFLDRELRTSEIPDYSGAHNGLQLENEGVVSKIAVAVDASLEVVERAVSENADLLIVHHGLFWQGVSMLTGGKYRKMKAAIDGGLAIYSSHIPLDVHPKWGNSALLAESLGLKVDQKFHSWKGLELGLAGEWQGTWEDLEQKVVREVGPILASTKNRNKVGRLGIITGGAGSEVEIARDSGIDTFLTGEGPHWSFPLAQELNLSVIFAGHYATETFGVREVGKILREKYGAGFSFIDVPSGL